MDTDNGTISCLTTDELDRLAAWKYRYMLLVDLEVMMQMPVNQAMLNRLFFARWLVRVGRLEG